MPDLTETPVSYPPAIPRVERTDIALGGDEVNVPNKQFSALTKRTRWLKDNLQQFLDVFDAIKLFGGNGAQGNFNQTSGSITLDEGYYFYNDFTVEAGATVNISKYAKIFCSGNVNIAGTINVSTFTSGGFSYRTGGDALGNFGGLSGGGPGGGSGSSAVGGQSYNYAAAPYGSGGASGFASSAAGANWSAELAPGGPGGGGLWIESKKSVIVTGTITANGGNGGVGVSLSGTPSVSGGGGGSGGLVLLSALIEVNVSGTISVRGGNGGNAIAGNGSGGRPGAGGQIVLIAPTITTTGSTLQIGAGVAGTNLGSNSLGGGNGAGFGGIGNGGAQGNGRVILRNYRGVAGA